MTLSEQQPNPGLESRDDIGLIRRIPRSRIRRFQDQPRHFFEAKEMADLAASIEEIGQQTPIVVKRVSDDPAHDYELIDGERRWIACGMAGVATMLSWIKPVADADDQFATSVVSNFGRVGHTPLEVAQAIDRIKKSDRMKDLPAGEQTRRVAKIFARSEVWVYQHLAILRLHPDVQAMMSPALPEDQRLGHLLGVFVSSLHPDLQLEIARGVIDKKMNINQARAFARQKAEAAGVQIAMGRRPRQPHDDYKNLVRFVTKVREGASIFLTSSVQEVLSRRNPKDLAALAVDIERGIDDLNELRAALIGNHPGSARRDP